LENEYGVVFDRTVRYCPFICWQAKRSWMPENYICKSKFRNYGLPWTCDEKQSIETKAVETLKKIGWRLAGFSLKAGVLDFRKTTIGGGLAVLRNFGS
jgi:hypothetical protein